MIKKTALAVSLCAVCVAPQKLLGQDSATAVATMPTAETPYDVLVLTLNNPNTTETIFRRMMDVDLPNGFLADPEIAEIEAMCPGSIRMMLTSSESVFRQIYISSQDEFQTGAVALLKGSLTPEEAQGAVDFYSSPLGMKLMTSVVDNFAFENVVSDVMTEENQKVTREAYDKDQSAAVLKGVAALDLSASEKLEMAMMAAGTTWMPKLMALGPDLQELRLKVDNGETTPEQDAALDAAMGPPFEAYFEKCLEAQEN